jgi:ketosteroid isomerase-like protein
LVQSFYDARARGDLAAVREMLGKDVVWREPDVGIEYTGELRSADSVIGMIQEASRLTDGTFSLRIREAVAHGEQVAAFIDWSSTRDGKTLEGKEIAVYREDRRSLFLSRQPQPRRGVLVLDSYRL